MMTAIADITLDTILARLRALEPAIRAHGITRLAVFGSRVRGDHRPDSDLDILIDKTSPYDDDAVAKLVEDATGLSVQISIRELLKPRIVERIADDVTEVF